MPGMVLVDDQADVAYDISVGPDWWVLLAGTTDPPGWVRNSHVGNPVLFEERNNPVVGKPSALERRKSASAFVCATVVGFSAPYAPTVSLPRTPTHNRLMTPATTQSRTRSGSSC